MMTISSSVVLLALTMQYIQSVGAVSACTTQQNAVLAACNSTFTGCVNGGEVAMCDCVSNRIECSNGLNCTEADVRGKAWFSECESDGLCSCPTTRVEKLCSAIVLTAQETYINCTTGAVPDATYCDCVQTFNRTVVSNQAACNNSNTDFPAKLAEIALYAEGFCSADVIAGCTPYQTKSVVVWADELSNCSTQFINGTVTRVGPYCQCLRSVRQKLPPNVNTRTCLIQLDTALDTVDALYDCAANINTTAICDTAKFDDCSSNKTTCMSVAAGNIANACSCYATYSKCLTANIACPGSQLAQAGVHGACKATCPITTDCGPEGKTFTIPTITAGPDSAPGGTDINGSPVTGAPNGGTNSDGSPATSGKTDSNGVPITEKHSAASHTVIGAAALLVASSAALLN